MKKLYKLKTWYTLEEAAARLSLTLSEQIVENDVVQLAAQGDIPVCWFLNGEHYARKVTVFCCYPRPQQHESPRIYSKPTYDENGESWGESLAGIFTLPMDLYPSWGWWLLTFVGKGGESGDWCGPLVIGGDGTIWELYEENKKSDFFHFPKKDEIVIKSEDLAVFEAQFLEQPADKKPLLNTERNTLLKLVIGMAIKGYSHDPTASKSKAPKEIADDLLSLGIDVSDDTVRKYLKQAATIALPAGGRYE